MRHRQNCSDRPRNCRDIPIGCDLPNTAQFPDEQVARAINGNAARIVELATEGGSAVAQDGAAASGYRANRSIRRNPADALIPGVEDEHITGAIRGDGYRIVERGARARPAIT